MLLVVDANILVGELLRVKGQELLTDKRLELLIAAKVWEEARHELHKRVHTIAERAELSERATTKLLVSSIDLVEKHITIKSEAEYGVFKREALFRIPRDPDDWHSVALALITEAEIWTQDNDFLGCGVGTWTSTTLRARLTTLL